MVFSSYNSTSYLPLDNDQSVTFYKNENRIFPTAIVPPSVAALPASVRGVNSSASSSSNMSSMSNMSTTDMLNAAYVEQQQQQPHHHRQSIGGSGSGSFSAGDCPLGRVQSPAATSQQHQQRQTQQPTAAFHHHQHQRLGGAVAMCDDFQPVAYLNGSSNGYYGYVPYLLSTAPANDTHNIHSTLNNNKIGPEGSGNSLLPASTAVLTGPALNVNRHHLLAGVHYGGGNGQGEHNNNNNSSFFDEREPSFPAGLLNLGKRKEMGDCASNLSQQDDFDMDTNAQPTFNHHPKRRKTGTEQTMMSGIPFPVHNGLLFDENSAAGTFRPEQHQPRSIEMDCQEQIHHHETNHPHLAQRSGAEEYANGSHSHSSVSQPAPYADHTATTIVDDQRQTNKSKYFDSSRCMMSHMI